MYEYLEVVWIATTWQHNIAAQLTYEEFESTTHLED